MLLERLPDSRDGFFLAVFAELIGGDHVGVVRGPVTYADVVVLADDFLEAHRAARGSVEERVAFVGGGPLRAGDEILAALLGRVGAAAGFGETVDEGALLVGGRGFG